MAGKKLYSLEKPDDRAKELASKLTLEEQVCYYPPNEEYFVHNRPCIGVKTNVSRTPVSTLDIFEGHLHSRLQLHLAI